MIRHFFVSRNANPAIRCAAALAALFLVVLAVPSAWADEVAIGTANQYAVLFEGGGVNTLQITNVTVNGNVGVGGTGKATDSGPSTINGRLDFSAANTGQFSNNNSSDVISGGVHYSVGGVTNALSTVNSLNTTLGAATGTGIVFNLSGTATQTVNESSGVLFTSGGVTYRVFNVTSFNTTDGNTIAIVGDGSGDAVVFNFTHDANFNNQVSLSGLNSDQVLFNFVGGSGLTGGPTLAINDNGHTNPGNLVQGIFLNPNGVISVTNTNLDGRVFGGDTHDMQIVSGDTITAPPGVVPEPGTLALLGSGILGLGSFFRRRK
jgi:hypothetical protein